MIRVRIYYGENYESKHYVDFVGDTIPEDKTIQWFMSLPNFLTLTISKVS